MVKSLLVTGGTALVTTAGQTSYHAYGNSGESKSTVEIERQTNLVEPGTISKLVVVISANAATGITTVRGRKNVANGIVTVSIAAAATGTFEDATNSDAVVNTDEYCYQVVAGAGGTVTIMSISTLFTPTTTTNTVTTLVNTFATNIGTASVTIYLGLTGNGFLGTTTESHLQHEVRESGTLKNLYVYISGNLRGTTTTVTSRKNGVNGALVVSIAGATTGVFSNTTNSDSLVANDDVCSALTTGTAAGTLTPQIIKFDFVTTSTGANKNLLLMQNVFGIAVDAVTTNYATVAGQLTAYTTETYQRIKLNDTATFSNLGVNVTANTESAAVSFKLRKTGADSSIALSVVAATTGFFENTTDTDNSFTATDNVCYQIVPGGGTGTMTCRNISVYVIMSTVSLPIDATVTAIEVINKFITKA